jgi:acyl-coenzyme A synthetase/AMP-(fatty) acid ligase
VLVAAGFHIGDAIAIDMPMNQYAVIAYLGIILAGCVVVSIADSFVPSEIATRLRLSEAKGIFTQVGQLLKFRAIEVQALGVSKRRDGRRGLCKRSSDPFVGVTVSTNFQWRQVWTGFRPFGHT